ncbi:MAG: hypothetical protein GEU81_03610, partial [Nitriliruptorales bacterium]|nr:hypothetical protein [Nitriliruptorales bacterium]
MRLVLRLAALPFALLFGWRRPGFRYLLIGALVAFLLLFSAHLADAVDSDDQPSGDDTAGQSINLFDRPQEPLDTDDTGNREDQENAPTGGDDDCQAMLGLPASIGCRLVSAGGGGIVSGMVGAATSSAFEGFVDAVADSAVYFLSEIASFLDTSTQPDVRSSWFTRQYDTMVALAALVLLPLVLVAIVDAVVHARPGQIARTLFIFVPVAAIATYVTLELVDMALVITDWASAYVSGGVAADTAAFLEGLGQVLSGSSGETLPTFAVFIGAIFTVFGAFLLWIELILRTAGINLAVLFLPLAFATLVWPRVSSWASKALRLLAALILSKFFIVAVISLGASILGGVDGGAGAGGGLEAVIAGVSLIALATFAPWLLWRALAPVEGAAILALAGAGRRSAGTTPPAGGQVAGVSRLGTQSGGPLPVAGVPVVGAAVGATRTAGGAASAAGGTTAASGDPAAGAAAASTARANADANSRRRPAAGDGASGAGQRGAGQRGDGQ